ncbi:hypothetical protein P9112_000909 [Eukaryota sp. TZLM1-RC]
MPIVTLSDLQQREFPNPYRSSNTQRMNVFGHTVDFDTPKEHDKKTLFTIFSVLFVLALVILSLFRAGLFSQLLENSEFLLNGIVIMYTLLSISGFILFKHYNLQSKDISAGPKEDVVDALTVYGVIYTFVNLIGLLLPTQAPLFWSSPLISKFGLYFGYLLKSVFEGFVYRGFFNIQILKHSFRKYGQSPKGYYLGLLFGHLVYTVANIPFLFLEFDLSFLVLAFLIYFLSTIYLVFIHMITGNVYVSIAMQMLYTVPATLTTDDNTARIPLFICLIGIMFGWRYLPFVNRRNTT